MIGDISISKGFRGSANLKRPGEKIQWDDARKLEYAKCALDPVYFCETYMKIVHVDRGLVPFVLYDYQKEMLIAMKEHRNLAINTSRQIGKSTVTCAFILWYVLFHGNKTVGLLANKGDTAREILGKITLAYEHLPKWLQQGVMEWNKGSIVLENNSRVLASATSGSAIRGYSLNLLFLDETAFIEGFDEFFTSVVPTISSGATTKMILVSTPNGLNHFYNIVENARLKKNSYHLIEVKWHQVPGRTQQWADKTLSDLNGNIEKFNQEYNAEFLGSSGTLISGSALKSMVAAEPIAMHNGFIQYYSPEPGHNYVIICDVSKGKGLDNSAFSVIDITRMPYRQVATFYDNITPYAEYAQMIFITAKLYNEAAVLVEINNIGESVANALYEDLEYEGLLFTENAGSRGKTISTKNAMKSGVDKGITTTKTVKAKGCSMLKLLIEQQQLIICDPNAIYELSRFSKKGASYEAEDGAHDDLVMGLVLFGWLTDQQFFKELTDINTLQHLRNQRQEEIENEMMSLGFVINDGRQEAAIFENSGRNVATFLPGGDFDRLVMNDKNDTALEDLWQRVMMGGA